jgi:hypothetical protein
MEEKKTEQKPQSGFTDEELQKIVKGASELRDRRESEQKPNLKGRGIWVRNCHLPFIKYYGF